MTLFNEVRREVVQQMENVRSLYKVFFFNLSPKRKEEPKEPQFFHFSFFPSRSFFLERDGKNSSTIQVQRRMRVNMASL